MARILLGVTGGIAAYKAVEIARLAVLAGHAVRVIQTPASQSFVGAATFSAITGAPVLTSEAERDPARGAFPGQEPPRHDPASHLQLVHNADILLVAPATANTIAKLAHGMADNLLTSAALAARCPVVVAPAMNDAMWEHPATVANVATLGARQVTIVDPGTGSLGTLGEWGVGRLAEPAQVLAAAERAIAASAPPRHGRGPWDGRRVLVTAGGTREPIDAVRYVGNRSSGRMGFALASAAAALGADVTVVAANVALPRDRGVRYVDVTTAAELQEACSAEFPACHVLLMAAAVADFRPAQPADDKLRKSGRDTLTLTLQSTPDVLSTLAARRGPGQTLVGFAAQTGSGAVARGREKLAGKGVDAVVVNDVARAGIGFDSPDNEVTIVTGDGEEHVARAGKDAVATAILRAVDALRARTEDPAVAPG